MLRYAAKFLCLALIAWPAMAQECALCFPAYEGDLDAVIAGIANGEDVNATDDGCTPLCFAMYQKQAKVALMLLEHGADPNLVQQDSWPPLTLAVNQGGLNLAESLLEHGADTECATPEGWTPLMLAAQDAAGEPMLSLLLEHHAHPNPATKSPWTPLALVLNRAKEATGSGVLRSVQLLLAYGADPNPSDPAAKPMRWVVSGDGKINKELFKLLLAAGADVNVQTWYAGSSLLSEASAAADPEYIELLLQHGVVWKDAGTERPDSNGEASLDIGNACVQGPERIKLMIRLGVDFTAIGPVRGAMVAENPACWSPENLRVLVDLGLYLDGDSSAINFSPLQRAIDSAGADQIKALFEAGAYLSPAFSRIETDSPALLGGSVPNGDFEHVFPLLVDHGANPDFVFPLPPDAVDPSHPERKSLTMLDLCDNYFQSLETLTNEGDRAALDAQYHRVRKLITDAIATRRVSKGMLKSAMLSISSRFPLKPENRTPEDDRLFKSIFFECLEQYHHDPGFTELRVWLAGMANAVLPGLPVPEQALNHESVARDLYVNATYRSDFLKAAHEYEAASRIAPWVGAYYKNLCTVYEISGSYGLAARNCEIYLRSEPSDPASVRSQLSRINEEIQKAQILKRQ